MMQELENAIYQAAALIETIDSTFIHCGYHGHSYRLCNLYNSIYSMKIMPS
jgi:hypothetical protein